jgi:putative methanogenesis marker 13 metalloprotein
MTEVLHPRPNPIIAAMYTLRDLEADVIVMHGPPGCGFTASRLLEEAGVRVVTTGMQEGDLVFGAEDKLIDVLRTVQERFSPQLIGVVGTCASMIIGENLDSAIRRAAVSATVLPIETHGCIGANTLGAIRTLEAAAERGVIPIGEYERQKGMLELATELERKRGMTSKAYLEPNRGITKLAVARKVVSALGEGKRVAVILNAKKETAFRFADVLRAVEYARQKVGGEVTYIGNIDPEVGLPRIRSYSVNILRDLKEVGVEMDIITGGLDEYAATGERAVEMMGEHDLRIIAGLPHAVPDLRPEDILVTDQPRELTNFLDQGLCAVGEISTHSALMGVDYVVHSEIGDTIREVVDG